jgi:hypothetical protein
VSILSDIYARAAGISGLKTAKKGKRQFHEGELPGISVYLGPAVVDEAGYGGTGYRMNLQVIVEYHSNAGCDPNEDWEAMVAAIRAAVELPDDMRLSNQLCEPLELTGIEAPELPDDAGGLVAAQVLYSAQYISQYGG